MVLVHINEETARLRYIFDFIFSEIIRIPFSFTKNEEEFRNSNLPKFTYGQTRIGDHFHIPATSILFETFIQEKQIEFKNYDSLPIFFSTVGGDMPFDIFAASFYLVSRYEEYIPHSKDRYNRYKAEESAAFKGGFLQRPIINLWVEMLGKKLKERYNSLHLPAPVFTFTPTIDIDNAYAYKYKGAGRVTMGLLQKLLKFEFKKLINRVQVHLGYRNDPYDSYEKQFRIHQSYHVKPLYFILLGDYGKYDRNLSHQNPEMIKLIHMLKEDGELGLHPSYNSNRSEKQLLKEKERLEKILGNKVIRSRQHYLKLNLPDTYQRLIKAGIKEDYSMGYSSQVGFRAGTSTPFYFFDLRANVKTELRIFPFVVMDATLKFYLKFRSREVIPFLKPIVSEIKRAGGTFIFIFHNESIGNQRNWKNWGDLYERIIQLSLSDQ